MSRRPTSPPRKARVAAAKPAYAEATGALTTAQGKLAQASDPSQVEAAAAQLYLAKQNLNYTHIYAATDGYIGEKSAEVGQTDRRGNNAHDDRSQQRLHHGEL